MAACEESTQSRSGEVGRGCRRFHLYIDATASMVFSPRPVILDKEHLFCREFRRVDSPCRQPLSSSGDNN